MRKTILMGLGLAVALAGTAAAQQGGQEAPGRSKVEKQGRFDKRGGAPDGFLLRGITLSDAQKVQVQELRKSDRAKLKTNREAAKSQMGEARAARQRGDTAAARATAQRNRQVMAQEREQHVAAVRGILTVEQRVQFDKNVAELKQRQQARAGQGGPRGKAGRFGR